jgi:hypothetical protein
MRRLLWLVTVEETTLLMMMTGRIDDVVDVVDEGDEGNDADDSIDDLFNAAAIGDGVDDVDVDDLNV